MPPIKGTVKDKVIQLLESINLSEGQLVIIVTTEEKRTDRSIQSSSKLSELLLPELEE